MAYIPGCIYGCKYGPQIFAHNHTYTKKKNNTHTKPNDSVEKTAGPMRKETQITEYVEIIKIKS